MSQFYQQLATLTPEQRALLAQKLAAKGLEKGLKTLGASAIPSITDRDQPLPLSFAQQRLWFLSQLEPESPFYNIPAAIQINGELDISILERCFQEIINRHEVLRTAFLTVEGKPVAQLSSINEFKLPIILIFGCDRFWVTILAPYPEILSKTSSDK